MKVHEKPEVESGDLVLKEIWRIKDEMAAEYKDVPEFFAAMRLKEKNSGGRVVDLSKSPKPKP